MIHLRARTGVVYRGEAVAKTQAKPYLRVFEKRLKPKIHMVLDVAMEQG
jgi:hypothetical protein